MYNPDVFHDNKAKEFMEEPYIICPECNSERVIWDKEGICECLNCFNEFSKEE